MIGLLAKRDEVQLAAEFFELFKTPWEPFNPTKSYEVVVSTGERPIGSDYKLLVTYSSEGTAGDADAGVRFQRRLTNRFVELEHHELPIYGALATISASPGSFGRVVQDTQFIGFKSRKTNAVEVRLGYDVFAEVGRLLTTGQPCENAPIPTLDLHIEVLRRLILEAGIPLVEIPPTPQGVTFISCLTHDIDFVAQRHHRFDRAMCGFFYRATLGTLFDFARGRCSAAKVGKNLAAAAKWPLVQLGLCEDPWLPFSKYLEAEQGKPSTFFLIPFKNRPGRAPANRDSSRRGVRYDVDDVKEWIPRLVEHGCEVAVHGIDAWADRARGSEELNRVAELTREKAPGVRMHWLYFSEESPKELEAAGFGYDSTCGYNDAVGYRGGTTQVFKVPGTRNLLELPLHMQDTALFFPGRMNLESSKAWALFLSLVNNCRERGGVLTVLWHDRSLAPERLWDDFYRSVLQKLDETNTWFGTARDVVAWFKTRRQVSFSSVQGSGAQLEVALDNVPATSPQELVLRVSYCDADSGEIVREDVPLRGRTNFRFTCPRARPAAMAAERI